MTSSDEPRPTDSGAMLAALGKHAPAQPLGPPMLAQSGKHGTRSPAPPTLTPGQWGMIAYLASDVALFSTLFVAYLIFFGRDALPGGLGGPTPQGVLSLKLVAVTTICLLASSATMHLAEKALRAGRKGGFIGLWLATIALGIAFLLGTAYEWRDLIYHDGLTISRNLFGTTFYTLVGFHALHVTAGVGIMLMVLTMALGGRLGEKSHGGIELVSWYWHFVDAVWIVVVGVVYLLPRFAGSS